MASQRVEREDEVEKPMKVCWSRERLAALCWSFLEMPVVFNPYDWIIKAYEGLASFDDTIKVNKPWRAQAQGGIGGGIWLIPRPSYRPRVWC